ncbi:MAG: ABC transporter ATP-binding protein [Syntrophobacterales bacterium]|jgi:ABC-2 type transport system ATP-binding protein|nr:ABC transporter ATP-binding protein [Syntrophobacterales bacterium]
MGDILGVHNLSKVYPRASRPALNGVNLTIGEGSIFGLLGPNGAGKTTAISIMSTLLQPTVGTVTICGIDTVKYPGQVRSLIGCVPQEIALYQNLTGRENLRFFGRMYGLRGKILEARVSESIDFVGLNESADQRVFTYSGGMKRRANLAVGILHGPKLLFLDEPTVGIDPQSRSLILERLARLKDRMTMVYTTHYMEEAELLCSYVAVIDAGSIIAEGPPAELISRYPGCLNLEALFIRLTGKQLRD